MNNDSVNKNVSSGELPELPPLPPLPQSAKPVSKSDGRIMSESDVANDPKTHVIMIEESDSPSDPADVFVSINGRAFLLKRGVEVPVSKMILGALDNAIATKVIDDGEGNRRERQYKRYPYRIIREL